MKESFDTIKTGVLVVGGGGAACRAALEADMAGADVVLAVKGAFASIGIRGAGTTAGGVSDRGGVAYPGIPGIQGFDPQGASLLSVEKDYHNILQLGLGMTDRRLARVLSEQAHEAMRPLLEDWSREVVPRQWGMKSHGIPIMFGLTRMLRRSRVRVMEHTMVTHLLVEGGRACGAVAVDEFSGEIKVIQAGAVILGTGGKGGLFKHSLAAPCTTGDGYAMAYRAGAEIMNFEFKQVFPGVVYPTINHFSAWFFVPHVKITNARGEEYLPQYLPRGISVEEVYRQRSMHGPFSARDSASRYFDVASLLETKAGRANEHDALYVDLTDPRVADPLARPRHDYFYYRGVRYLEEPVQFNICFHCSNGGVRIDENAESTVRGLYAAGECASGPHGANRMAGHMLSASQVFGKIAGRHAAATTASRTFPDASPAAVRGAVEEIRALKSQTQGEKPRSLIKDLQRLAWETMLVHVNEGLLDRALREIREIREDRWPRIRVQNADDLVNALELKNLLLVGEMLARTTRMRKESRGDLYREDFPRRDDREWNRVILVKSKGEEMHLETEVLDPDWPASERKEDMGGLRWG